jgi:hypothetical protein
MMADKLVRTAAMPAFPSEEVSVAQRLYDTINSAWVTQAIYVAAELGLADEMDGSPRDAIPLAVAAGCPPDALRRLLRALCAVGICEDCGNDAYSLTQLGMLLRKDAPESLHGWAVMWGSRLWTQWGALLDSVRTGQGRTQRIGSRDGYAHLDHDRDAAQIFYTAMRSITRIVTSQAARLADLGAMRSVVDVGGGHGEFMAAVLQAWPLARGICLDLPAAATGAGQLFSCAGLDSRAEFLAGDFFKEIPSADALLLKSVLHNWDDVRCDRILANCRRALGAGKPVLIIERVMPATVSDCNVDRSVAHADLNMLAGIGGKERTIAEFRRMLSKARLELTRIHRLPLGFALLECVAAT